MIAGLTGLLSGAWLRVAIIAAAAGAVLAILFGARQAGRQAERVDTLKRTVEVIHAQRQAAARAPADEPAVVDSLRDGTF